MRRVLLIGVFVSAVAAGAFAADLTIDSRIDVTGKDPKGSYFTFKTASISVEKDQVDATTAATRGKSMDSWNSLAVDAGKKRTLPNGIQGLVKFAIVWEKQYQIDQLSATKASDGTITIQYQHRGVGYKIVTDKTGKLSLPEGNYLSRKIGLIDKAGSVWISADFAPSGKPADIDWAKVWDPQTPSGNPIGTSAEKTGLITKDVPVAEAVSYSGNLQATLKGTVLTLAGELNLKK